MVVMRASSITSSSCVGSFLVFLTWYRGMHLFKAESHLFHSGVRYIEKLPRGDVYRFVETLINNSVMWLSCQTSDRISTLRSLRHHKLLYFSCPGCASQWDLAIAISRCEFLLLLCRWRLLSRQKQPFNGIHKLARVIGLNFKKSFQSLSIDPRSCLVGLLGFSNSSA